MYNLNALIETIKENVEKAIKNPENINEDGTINWNFVDSDAYCETVDNPAFHVVFVENHFYDHFDSICDEVVGI
jgi:hypothetical protein